MINKKFLFVFIVLLLLSQACNFTKIIDKPAADPPPQDLPKPPTVDQPTTRNPEQHSSI